MRGPLLLENWCYSWNLTIFPTTNELAGAKIQHKDTAGGGTEDEADSATNIRGRYQLVESIETHTTKAKVDRVDEQFHD